MPWMGFCVPSSAPWSRQDTPYRSNDLSHICRGVDGRRVSEASDHSVRGQEWNACGGNWLLNLCYVGPDVAL